MIGKRLKGYMGPHEEDAWGRKYAGSYRLENGEHRKWGRYGVGGDGRTVSCVGDTLVRLI